MYRKCRFFVSLVVMLVMLAAGCGLAGAGTFAIADKDPMLWRGEFTKGSYGFSIPNDVIEKSEEYPYAFCEYMKENFIPDFEKAVKYESSKNSLIGKIAWDDKDPQQTIFKMHEDNVGGELSLIANVIDYQENYLKTKAGDFIITNPKYNPDWEKYGDTSQSLLFLFSDEKGNYNYLALGLWGGQMSTFRNRDGDFVFSMEGMEGVKFSLACGAVKASSVPIPGAFWLLGSGLLGLVGVRRRSRG